MPDCLPAALAYAARGWRVLALSPGSKIPIADSLLQPNGSLSATTDAAHIRKLWETYPNANVGIATGKESNLTVVDYDGPEVTQALKSAGLSTPNTYIVKTRKGYHVYLPYDPDLKQGAKILPGLDVRNDGGYVVAPPSVVMEHVYTVYKDRPLKEWPELTAHIATLKAQRPTAEASKVSHPSWVSEMLANGAPEGQRNDAASRLAGYFRSLNIPQDITLAALMGFARQCQPPMSESELQAVMHSVWRYAPARPTTYQGHKIPRPLMDSTSDTRRKFMWPDDGIEVLLDHLRIRDDGVHCWITVSHMSDELYGPIRLNLLSESGREGLRRALKDRREHDWQSVLDHVARFTVRSFDVAEPRVDVTLHVPTVASPWLVYPFVRSKQPSVIYGDGGTGKSTLAMAIAISLACGKPVVPGMEVESQAPIIYGDWETDEDDASEVAQYVARGAGLVIPKDTFIYRRFSGPLPEHVDTLLKDIAETGARMIVIDSAIAAAGEDAHGPDAPRMHYNALRQLGESSLTLTHVPSQSDRMYGNVMWRNLSRVAWLMESKQDDGANFALLGLYQKKGNRGKSPKPIGLKVTFETQSIAYTHGEIADDPELAKKLSLSERISYVLRSGSMSITDIAEETGIEEGTVRATLNAKRYRGILWQKLASGQWGLLERNVLRNALRNVTSPYGRERVTSPDAVMAKENLTEKDRVDTVRIKAEKEDGGDLPW